MLQGSSHTRWELLPFQKTDIGSLSPDEPNLSALTPRVRLRTTAETVQKGSTQGEVFLREAFRLRGKLRHKPVFSQELG